MKRNRTLFYLALLGLILAACGGLADSAKLAGSAWNLTAIKGQPILPKTTPTLSFDSEQVSGHGSCNRFGGDYRAQGDQLTFGPLMSTLMACAENGISEQESAYFSALAAAKKYQVSAGRLLIFDEQGRELLSFAQQK